MEDEGGYVLGTYGGRHFRISDEYKIGSGKIAFDYVNMAHSEAHGGEKIPSMTLRSYPWRHVLPGYLLISTVRLALSMLHSCIRPTRRKVLFSSAASSAMFFNPVPSIEAERGIAFVARMNGMITKILSRFTP
jgi:hypothetical protein